MILNLAEVHIGVKFTCLGNAETSESIISSNLVLVSQLVRTLRNDVAVVFNRVNSELQAIEFGEVARHNLGSWVFLFG